MTTSSPVPRSGRQQQRVSRSRCGPPHPSHCLPLRCEAHVASRDLRHHLHHHRRRGSAQAGDIVGYEGGDWQTFSQWQQKTPDDAIWRLRAKEDGEGGRAVFVCRMPAGTGIEYQAEEGGERVAGGQQDELGRILGIESTPAESFSLPYSQMRQSPQTQRSRLRQHACSPAPTKHSALTHPLRR